MPAQRHVVSRLEIGWRFFEGTAPLKKSFFLFQNKNVILFRSKLYSLFPGGMPGGRDADTAKGSQNTP
jgi:hypothetical protein